MRLITAEEFVQGDYFAGKPPQAKTIRNGVRSGEIPGMVSGRRVWVDLDGIRAQLMRPKAPAPQLQRASAYRV